MTTEMITLKLEKKFLSEIDKIVDEGGYQSRTEFIRQSLRAGMDEAKHKKAMEMIIGLRGSIQKKNISEEEYERNRQEAFEEIGRRAKNPELPMTPREKELNDFFMSLKSVPQVCKTRKHP